MQENLILLKEKNNLTNTEMANLLGITAVQ